MTRILVSACLLGQPVRYDGRDAAVDHPALRRWADEGRIVPLCPELAGGLATPRPPAEIVGDGGGAGVLDGTAIVRDATGADVTAPYRRGAEAALELCKAKGVGFALLKARSPSCGFGSVYDGTFRGRTIAGDGVTAALLVRHGVRVFSEEDMDGLNRALREA